MKNSAAQSLAAISWETRRKGKDIGDKLSKAGSVGGKAVFATRGPDYFRELQKRSVATKMKRKNADKHDAIDGQALDC